MPRNSCSPSSRPKLDCEYFEFRISSRLQEERVSGAVASGSVRVSYFVSQASASLTSLKKLWYSVACFKWTSRHSVNCSSHDHCD